MTTTRLALYNGACSIIGERSLASLTEDREPRHLLDEVWNDGGVRYCLEQAQWKFALRAARLDYDPAVTPSWGYRRAFGKPTDWVLTSGMCSDEYFRIPLLNYLDEAQYWFCDLDQIYVRYISDDALYGGDLTKWPYSFVEYVKQHFAWKICTKITAAKSRREEIVGPPGEPHKGSMGQALLLAKNKDAMAVSTEFAAQGNWSRARRGRGSSTLRDGGNRNSLLG
jgi:hypothetical protein